MSYNRGKTTIENGDVVVLYMGINKKCQLKIEVPTDNDGRGVSEAIQTIWGYVKPKSLIGLSYGSKIQLSKGWAFVLSANPDLWTYVLPHKTQIIYGDDISSILFELDIQPGHIVVESGTGSGSLTNAIIHCVKDTGHLFTFDFHDQRVAEAQETFRERNLTPWVTVVHRDVLNKGFGSEFHNRADAVFLDLPSPAVVVPYGFNTLKNGGKICIFLPCVEQLEEVMEQIRMYPFENINTFEVLRHDRIVRNHKSKELNLDYLQVDVDENNPDHPLILADALDSEDECSPPNSPVTNNTNGSETASESPESPQSCESTPVDSSPASSNTSPTKSKSNSDLDDSLSKTSSSPSIISNDPDTRLSTITVKESPAPGHSGFLIIADKAIGSDDEDYD